MPAKGQPGPQHDAETRKKISEGVKKAYRENPFMHWKHTGSYKPKGFQGHHSEETKQRISENRKGKCKGNTQGFTKGHDPWNKGKPHKVHTAEWRKKVSLAVAGANHWNWKGGVSAINCKLRNTTKYKEWRNAVYQRDDWTCQHCFKKQQRFTIVAHHVIPWTQDFFLRFTVSNGLTLCRKCHCALHKPRTGTGKSPKPQSV